MFKLILIIAVVFVIYKTLKPRPIKRDTAAANPTLVPCKHCGVHVLLAHCVVKDSQVYCSDAHSRHVD